MKLLSTTTALLLLGTGIATLVPTASAHPVQFLCGQPLGYTAIGPGFDGLNVWLASVGTGGLCVDYVFVCFYDPYVEDPCTDGRHVNVPVCYKACIDALP